PRDPAHAPVRAARRVVVRPTRSRRSDLARALGRAPVHRRDARRGLRRRLRYARQAVDDRFGPFQIISRLARGGMGETFIAERDGPAGFAQRVCLKRILPDENVDASWTAMFLSEARMVARLQHANIVPLIDFGKERGSWWMSLALVDGVDLRRILTALRSSA